MRFAFAGDRDIAVWVLDHILASGHQPLALLVSDTDRATHDQDLIARCANGIPVLRGNGFRTEEGVATLASLDLDFVVGIHFPYIIPSEVLELPRQGVINLHPAYLPYNRGWHTPSWAILEGTPVGATLHFMEEAVDAGDIIHQRALEVAAADTADSLYARLKELEYDVFKEAWPNLVNGTFSRTPQDPGAGTSHQRRDLFDDSVRQIDLERPISPADLLRKLRALTTNDPSEAAFFDVDGQRFHVQINIEEAPPED